MAGTWTVTSSCLSVAGQMDISVLGIGCTLATVTGSLKVTGTWIGNADGTYLDNTTTSGNEQLTLPAPCLQISGTTTTCERVAPVVQSLGYAVTMCVSDASGGCTCSATVNQTGSMGVVNPDASRSGEYTTSGTAVALNSEVKYSFCVSGNQLKMTPQGTSPTTTGTVVLEKSGSPGSGGATATGGSGGTSASGGVLGNGGAGGTGGTAGSGSSYGLPCTTNQDCPSDATCCDGSEESCDGTRMPSGNSTNAGEFVVSADGLTVTDTITGLLWQRDDSGARSSCASGTACTWAESQAYCASLSLGGVSGWRLPARNELSTIVDFTKTNPCIDETAFPNAPSDWFQTSSSNAYSPGWSWNVSFYIGFSDANEVGRVRCVRGSRCYPINRFAVLDGGLVRDTLTSLVWQQQASTTMTWEAAQSYCSSAGSGFRLPAAKELISLVDLTVTSGATINQAAFPNAPAETFWTSSPNVGSSGYPWHVQFGYGGYSDGYDIGDASRVRCVR